MAQIIAKAIEKAKAQMSLSLQKKAAEVVTPVAIPKTSAAETAKQSTTIIPPAEKTEAPTAAAGHPTGGSMAQVATGAEAEARAKVRKMLVAMSEAADKPPVTKSQVSDKKQELLDKIAQITALQKMVGQSKDLPKGLLESVKKIQNLVGKPGNAGPGPAAHAASPVAAPSSPSIAAESKAQAPEAETPEAGPPSLAATAK